MDIQYVENCIRHIGNLFNQVELTNKVIIVEKSTVPTKTSHHMTKILQELQINYPSNRDKFDVISNPEFLSEGKIQIITNR